MKQLMLLFYIIVMFRINGINHTIKDVSDFHFEDNYLILECSKGAEMRIHESIIEKLDIRR